MSSSDEALAAAVAGGAYSGLASVPVKREDTFAIAACMRANGASWASITRATGIGIYKLRRELEPGWREERIKQVRAYQARFRERHGNEPAGLGNRLDYRQPAPDEARRVLADVPRDTRGLTARIMGDPVPGRSALDRRQQ